MKRILAPIAFVAAFVAFLAGFAASAHDIEAGDLTILHPHAFASIGNAKTGAAYLGIQNNGKSDDALIGVSTGFAVRNEIHTHLKEGGRMMMRPVDRIEVPAGTVVHLEQGGLHLMFMGLSGPFKAGEMRPIILVFEKAGEVPVDMIVVER